MVNDCKVVDDKESKKPKTPEELAQIAYLDKLRSGEGEVKQEGLSLAAPQSA